MVGSVNAQGEDTNAIPRVENGNEIRKNLSGNVLCPYGTGCTRLDLARRFGYHV